jgi:hypothetical protein
MLHHRKLLHYTMTTIDKGENTAIDTVFMNGREALCT